MTSRGAGLSHAITEKNPTAVNSKIQQLIEGRSNAVVTFTLTNDGVATSTTVTAPTCGPNSIVTMPCPTTSAASTFLRGSSMYIALADITKGQFIVTHATTSTANLTFMCECRG